MKTVAGRVDNYILIRRKQQGLRAIAHLKGTGKDGGLGQKGGSDEHSLAISSTGPIRKTVREKS